MKLFKIVLAIALSLSLVSQVFAKSPEGDWTTIDDKTGSKRAMVSLKLQKDGQLAGTIVDVFAQDGDSGVCKKCPEPFNNKPVKGLQFLWGLRDKGNGVWSGGKILDPKSGKIYSAKLTVKHNKIYVRGYIGLSMLGRTQVWVR